MFVTAMWNLPCTTECFYLVGSRQLKRWRWQNKHSLDYIANRFAAKVQSTFPCFNLKLLHLDWDRETFLSTIECFPLSPIGQSCTLNAIKTSEKVLPPNPKGTRKTSVGFITSSNNATTLVAFLTERPLGKNDQLGNGKLAAHVWQ